MPVVVVPVMIRAPSVGFDVPPSVAVIPTIFARLVQFVTRMLGLAAVPAVMFDRFVEMMICLFGPMLAFRLAGTDTWCAGEKQKTSQRR
jgi:membrane glycosyltransferase